MRDGSAAITVGLVPQGGANWIAGVVYLENIVRAVLTSNGGNLRLCYIASAEQQLDRARSEMSGIPEHFYTHRSRWPGLRAARNCLKFRRPPTSLASLARRIGLDVMFPLQTPPSDDPPVPWIGWIPDFQHKRYPDFFSETERADRDRCFQQLVHRAPHMIVSSLDARADLMRWFPRSDGRVSVLQFRTVPSEAWFVSDPKEIVRRLHLPRKYLIYPSQFWIHKNHHTVLAALKLLRAKGRGDIVLVCTGREYDYRWPGYAEGVKDEIRRLGLDEQVRCLGLLDRLTQIQVMRAAAAIVQASLFEGWSALIEDARALGKRVFVSDIPVHREQNPPDAVYFNPESAEQLAELIERDWAHLQPGPDCGLEADARRRQEALTRDFADRFTDLVISACSRRDPS